MTPPFRVEHVGSFVRPEALLNAARARKAGQIDEAEFRSVQDAAIHDIVRFQESLGLPSVTDGEFRRRSWSAGFIDAVDGFGLRDGTLSFRDETKVIGIAASPYAKAPLKRRRRIVADDYRFLKSVVKKGVPKVTIAAPDVMHYFLGPKAFDAYPEREAFFADLAQIYRDEISELAAEGCTYLQLDDTAFAYLCDPKIREACRKNGDDPEKLPRIYAQTINRALEGRPAGMTITMHTCRGNFKSAWVAQGGYESVAEAMFSAAVDAFFMEFDSARAGTFEPLRALPKGKTVVLGLVTTKTGEMESRDELKKRIDEAAKFVPLENLCLSPQCGFSSTHHGNALTMDEQWRKLELVVGVAQDVWGSK